MVPPSVVLVVCEFSPPSFNKPVARAYLAYLDINGDGTINSGDNLQFRNGFNKALT